MGFESFVTERLAAITEMLNDYNTNAKTIAELPPQNTLDTSSLIHVSRAGISEKLEIQKIITAILNYEFNRLISIAGEITVLGNDVTVPPAIWVMENVHYQTITDTVINVPYAETGYTRNDIFVANKFSQIFKVTGPETEGISPTPAIPVDTVLVTVLNVTDSTVSYVPPPYGKNQFSIAFVEINGDDSSAEIGKVDKPFLTIEAALDALPSTGGVIKIGIGTFQSPDKTKIKANCFFIGSGKPYPNITVNYTDETSAPNYSSPTKLVGGTILTGNFYIDKVDNVQVSDLGIDCGKDFIDAFRAGVTEEGLTINGVLTSANNNNTMPPIKGIRINNVSSLNYSATAPRHAVLVQDGFDISFTNISTYFGVHGIALKGRNINANNLQCFGHSTDGLIIKSDKYSYASDISVNNVFITSIGSFDGGGIIFESGGDSVGGTDNRLYRANVNNVNIRFAKFGIIDLGGLSKTDNINVSNVNIYNVSASAIYSRSNSKNVTFSNINIDRVSTGNAVTLISNSSDDVKTLSNCVVRNANGVGQNGYFFNGVGGKVNLVNVFSPDSNIVIDGGSTSNVSGYGVKTSATFSGTLLFDATNATDILPSIDANGLIKKSLATVSALGGGVFPNGVSGKSLSATFGASNTVGSGSFFALTNGLAAGAQRQMVSQLSASNDIIWFYFNGTTFVNTGLVFKNTGAIELPSLSLTTAPATSAATYDVLTRNTSTGVTEKIPSSRLAASGTYTPTITGIANYTSYTFVSATYTIVGESVTVLIDLTVKPTAANLLTEFSISLPVAVATFVGTQASIGVGTFANTDYLAVRVSKTNSTTAKASFKTLSDINSGSISLMFTYQK
ncbi:hypothetical protein [Flavobacterium sp. 1355]|uniref:hypothetical protein n=1 Tax=Flavobacterium sp. 1355 TaxID=2806571 RepID=UPI001AE77F4D|nr:hypothetical protein [Flavobacterium sp. 1355]MBP1222668.1 hypothetical protein [Flavobacterium sp. 1355]